MLSPTEVQTVSSPIRLVALGQLLDTGGPFDTSTLFLVSAAFIPSPDLVYADLTKPTASGFAPVAAITFSDPYYDVDGTAVALSADHVFVADDADDLPITIYGYGLANGALDTLRAVWALADPVGIARVGDGFACAVFLKYSGT